MPSPSQPAPPARRWPGVVSVAAGIMLAATALLTVTAILPKVDLSGWTGVALYYLAATGIPWVPHMIALQIGVFVLRTGLTLNRRVREAAVLSLLLAIFIGGTFLINERGIKLWLYVSRPNLQELAQSHQLGLTAAEFYALPTRSAKREHLKSVLTEARSRQLGLHPLVREHWLVETGFSFPSSHATVSFATATFFLAAGLSIGGWRRGYAIGFLVPWAIAVCCSRTLLQVHTTLDICVGALEGTLAGLAAFAVVRKIHPLPTRPQ